MALTAKKAYAAATTYTDESLVGVGALKGAPCTIKSIEKKDGQSTVTFEWTATDGTKRTSKMIVDDGTPIYVWESGNTYKYGDLVIYASAFYRCIYDNSDTTFDESHWQEIGSSDGNYDIVPDKNFLPTRFTSADKKMFYAYEEDCFYFWNGFNWSPRLKLKAGNGITIEKDVVTGETIIATNIKSITSEELAEMWKD